MPFFLYWNLTNILLVWYNHSGLDTQNPLRLKRLEGHMTNTTDTSARDTQILRHTAMLGVSLALSCATFMTFPLTLFHVPGLALFAFLSSLAGRPEIYGVSIILEPFLMGLIMFIGLEFYCWGASGGTMPPGFWKRLLAVVIMMAIAAAAAYLHPPTWFPF